MIQLIMITIVATIAARL